MSEVVSRRCDYRIPEKRKYRVCGKPIPDDVPTVFSIGEIAYAVDLCEECKLRLDEALAPFIEISDTEFAKVGSAVRKALQAFDGSRFTLADVREWARQQGYPVADTGMLRQSLIDSYREAH